MSNVEAQNIVNPAPLRLGVIFVGCKDEDCGGRAKAGSSRTVIDYDGKVRRFTYYYCERCGQGQKVNR